MTNSVEAIVYRTVNNTFVLNYLDLQLNSKSGFVIMF